MRTTHRWVLTTAAALAALTPTAIARADTAPARPDYAAALHRVTDTGALAALAEVRDGSRTWRGSSGPARLGSDRPAPVDGRIRAGSITKTFVATVVLQLHAEHRLRLSDSVDHWLPGAIPEGRHITLLELLNHTGGVPNVVDALPLQPLSKFLAIRNRTWTPRQLVDLANTLPRTGDPGKAWKYSDTDYVLLGMVIRRATGHDASTEIDRRIVAPLHLRDTSLPRTYPRLDGPHPHGYIPVEQPDGSVRPVDITTVNPSVFGDSGGLVSSTRDLDTFFAALLGGRLLPRAELARMQVTAYDSNYGLGLRALPLTCHQTAWGHDGDVPGYSNWSYGLPGGRRVATVATTPLTAKPKEAALAMIDSALCGRTG